MKIHIDKSNKEMEIRFSGKVMELLTELKINPEEVLVTKNDILLTEDSRINDGDEIHILSVVSGG